MPKGYQPWSGFDVEHEAYRALVHAVRAYANIRELQGHRLEAVKQDMKKIIDNFDVWNQDPV